jgi:hypothetical protein
VKRLPHDFELERSVLAELVEPLHRLHALDEIGVGAFHDGRHRRIFTALRDHAPLSAADHKYLDGCVAYAWPLCRGAIERLEELARRRALALDLLRELDKVLTPA